jgi:hypothetical protein
MDPATAPVTIPQTTATNLVAGGPFDRNGRARVGRSGPSVPPDPNDVTGAVTEPGGSEGTVPAWRLCLPTARLRLLLRRPTGHRARTTQATIATSETISATSTDRCGFHVNTTEIFPSWTA